MNERELRQMSEQARIAYLWTRTVIMSSTILALGFMIGMFVSH